MASLEYDHLQRLQELGLVPTANCLASSSDETVTAAAVALGLDVRNRSHEQKCKAITTLAAENAKRVYASRKTMAAVEAAVAQAKVKQQQQKKRLPLSALPQQQQQAQQQQRQGQQPMTSLIEQRQQQHRALPTPVQRPVISSQQQGRGQKTQYGFIPSPPGSAPPSPR